MPSYVTLDNGDADVRDPIATVRRAILINTPSLIIAKNQPVPEEIARDLFLTMWDAEWSGVACPEIFVKDDEKQTAPQRGRTVVVIDAGMETKMLEGHTQDYMENVVPLSVQVHSSHSRQMRENVVGELERIWFKFRFAVKPYDRLTHEGYTREYDMPGMWIGTLELRMERHAPVMFAQVGGKETPNWSPEMFSPGPII